MNLQLHILDHKENITSTFGRSYSNGGMNFISFISNNEEIKKFFIIDSELDFTTLIK